MTSVMQPCDAGIIKSFKCHYLHRLTEFYCDQLEREVSELTPPTLKDCIYFTLTAWAGVSEDTIANCWNAVKILDSQLEKQFNLFACIDVSDNIAAKIDKRIEILNLSRFEYKSNCTAK